MSDTNADWLSQCVVRQELSVPLTKQKVCRLQKDLHQTAANMHSSPQCHHPECRRKHTDRICIHSFMEIIIIWRPPSDDHHNAGRNKKYWLTSCVSPAVSAAFQSWVEKRKNETKLNGKREKKRERERDREGTAAAEREGKFESPLTFLCTLIRGISAAARAIMTSWR